MSDELVTLTMKTDLFIVKIEDCPRDTISKWYDFHVEKINADGYLFPVHLNGWAINRGLKSAISSRFSWKGIHWWFAGVLAIWVYGFAIRTGAHVPWWRVGS